MKTQSHSIERLSRIIYKAALQKYKRGQMKPQAQFGPGDQAAMMAAHEKRMRRRQRNINIMNRSKV